MPPQARIRPKALFPADARFEMRDAGRRDACRMTVIDTRASDDLGRRAWSFVRLAEDGGFSAAPVRGGKEHYHDPHLRARGTVCSVDDPLYGRVDEYGPAPKLSESPGRVKWSAKPVGWHNEWVFGGLLEMTAMEMKALERKKVIGKWADVPGARPPKGSTAA